MSRPQGWADLLDDLLHSIVAMLGSFRDLLAFAATCTSWRAAFSLHPSKSTLLPPLLLQRYVPVCYPRPDPFSNSLVPKPPCRVTNLANKDMYTCCQIPLLDAMNSLGIIGASYGHLILPSHKQSCLVDVFTGAIVTAPQQPDGADTQVWHATLTAPLASPNSHLMFTTFFSLSCWRVGSHSWSSYSTPKATIKNIVVFKDQVFGMDYYGRLFIVHLVPQEIAIQWVGGSSIKSGQWFVVCGNMLLMVCCTNFFPSSGDIFEAFRLDLLTEHAKWVKVEKLENLAIFIVIGERWKPLCCMNPEIWGGKSNHIYFCYNYFEGWVECELGEPLQSRNFGHLGSYATTTESMWVVPIMFS